MDNERRRKQSFLLRLPLSVRAQATEIAEADGTSLNHFISLAVAEKISRMDQDLFNSGSKTTS
jgi:predicted HicB family RNase H-like nuclease